jgi:hypothetical protein
VVLDRSLLDDNYTVILNIGANAAVNDLDIINENTPSPNTNKPIHLIVRPARTLTVHGSFSVKVPPGSAHLAMLTLNGNANPAIPAMIVMGSWDNSGSFYSENSLIRFGSSTPGVAEGTRIIYNYTEDPLPPTPPDDIPPSDRLYNTFNNVEIASGYTEIVSHFLIRNNLTIGSLATLDANVGSFPITIEGNWFNAGLFKHQRGTVTFAGVKPQTMRHTPAGTFENYYTLKIQKRIPPPAASDSVVFESKATVANELNLQNGRFIASEGNELIMLIDNIQRRAGAPATTAYVQGPLGHLYSGSGTNTRSYFIGDRRYPDAAAKLSITLNNANPNAATVFTVEQIDRDPDPSVATPPLGTDRYLHAPYNYLSKSRHWKVKNIMFPATTPVGNNADFTAGIIELPFAPNDERIDTTTTNTTVAAALAQVLQLGIVQDSVDYSGGVSLAAKRGTALKGTDWHDLGGKVNANVDPNDPDNTGLTPTIVSRVFTRLGNGEFAFAFNFTPLPVESIMLNALSINKTVQLTWSFSNEKKAGKYQVQRSIDRENFVTIGVVDVRVQNNSSLSKYVFLDKEPNEGINYYRIQAVGIDGQQWYSDIVSEIINLTDGSILVYPNPSDGKIVNIRISNDSSTEETVITLFDLVGKQVYMSVVKNHSSEISHTFSQPVPAGVYLLNVRTKYRVYQKKIYVKP